MTAATTPMVHNITISDDERAELIQLLEKACEEGRVEMHRTHTPEYRDRVSGEQMLLRGLLDKLQHMRVDE